MKKNILFSAILVLFLSACKKTRTYVPDDTFEHALIYWGYDDVMDDYVLTANIDTITSLSFGEQRYEPPFNTEPHYVILDFTGIEGFRSLEHISFKNHLFGPTELDLSQNAALKTFYSYESEIEKLDFSENINLNSVFVSDTDDLRQLDLKNENNINMTLTIEHTAGLPCIQVDNATWSTTNWSASVNVPGVVFSENCSYP